MENQEIVSWIRQVLNAENYIDFKIELKGKNAPTEGYSSDMVFTKVKLVGKDEKYEELCLAIKFSKSALHQMPIMRDVYLKEILFYDKILNIFTDFQNKRSVSNQFDSIPKYYASLVTDTKKILVLENLCTKGYEMHKRNIPMNSQHFELVFKEFARFHAISLALRNQDYKTFEEVEQLFPVRKELVSLVKELLIGSFEKVIEYLKEVDRDDLALKLNKLLSIGIENILKNIISQDVDQKVLCHFDCHCNNFLFKYEDRKKQNPVKVAIVDWQVAQVHSPVIDLSYFFYSVASGNELSNRLQLLKYYHEELSKYLTSLGSNIEDIFPFSLLLDHWKKYSSYGFIYATCFMDFNYVSDEEAPSLSNVDAEENSIAKVLSTVRLKDCDAYTERLVNIIEHYFK